MKLLEGKVALVTGATRGIGKGIVLKLAEHGANVGFTFVSSDEKASALQKELESFGVTAKAYKSDASSYEATELLITNMLEDFGSIDILVNNAGITRDGLLLRMSEDNFDLVIETNLKSIFNSTKAIQKTFLKQRSGSIINITSIVGLTGNAGQSNYAASKAGAIGFTKSIALELGSRNIRCNAVAPGFIFTEMTEELDENITKEWSDSIPLRRCGTTEEVANLVLFLASDLSTYITGQVINVDGGMRT